MSFWKIVQAPVLVSLILQINNFALPFPITSLRKLSLTPSSLATYNNINNNQHRNINDQEKATRTSAGASNNRRTSRSPLLSFYVDKKNSSMSQRQSVTRNILQQILKFFPWTINKARMLLVCFPFCVFKQDDVVSTLTLLRPKTFVNPTHTESLLASWLSSSSLPSNSSTIPSPIEAARRAGVKPALTYIPSWVWKWMFWSHQRLLPLLHWTDQKNIPLPGKTTTTTAAMDRTTTNSCYSLWVLWNKALSAQDQQSPSVYDNGWTYDMLPPITRNYIGIIPYPWFPRMYHATIEVRTAYINQMIQKEILHQRQQHLVSLENQMIVSSSTPNYRYRRIRLVSLGCGYDVRCTRLLSTLVSQQQLCHDVTDISSSDDTNTFLIDEAWELDLENVIQPKQIMLERLQSRRRKRQQQKHQKRQNKIGDTSYVTTSTTTVDCNDHDVEVRLPFLRAIDLNNSTQRAILFNEIFLTKAGKGLSCSSSSSTSSWHTIFLVEAVFIYLNKGVPHEILKQCYDTIASIPGSTGSLCFADRIENVTGTNHHFSLLLFK